MKTEAFEKLQKARGILNATSTYFLTFYITFVNFMVLHVNFQYEELFFGKREREREK